MKILYDALN